jgi:hypothetical protein
MENGGGMKELEMGGRNRRWMERGQMSKEFKNR